MTLKEDILSLREQGLNYNQIVTELGCAKSTVSYYCGQDQNTKNLVRQNDRRTKLRKFIQEFKDTAICMDCGTKYPYYVLDFDHRPGEVKLFNIGQHGKNTTLKSLKDEIAKCDIVCANCHRIRTWQRLVKTGEYIL